MLRNIGGVILGYVLTALTIFLTFTAAYLLMGTSNAFKPDTYEVSNLWMVTSLVLGTVAAIIGGYFCALVARGSRAPLALAVLFIVVGVLTALPTLRAANTARERLTRPAVVSNTEAMQNAVLPGWYALLTPFASAAGVLVGAGLRRRRLTV